MWNLFVYALVGVELLLIWAAAVLTTVRFSRFFLRRPALASTIINTGATLSVAVLALSFYSAGAAWALTALCFVSSGVGVGLVITDMALKRVRGPFIEAAKLAWLSGSVMMCVGFAVIVGLTFNREPAEFFGVMKACSFYLVSGIINAGAGAGLAQWQASQCVAVVVETRHPRRRA